MADFAEPDGKNLLHLAAQIAVAEEDTSFFVRLLDLKFPLYHADSQKNYPAFILTDIKNDSKFLTSYYAMLESGFDLNYPNKEGLTFLQKQIINSESLSMNRITGIV